MKTRQPLILTARIDESDMAPFDILRTMHFPPERNFLRAHVTVFHHLPGEYLREIARRLDQVVEGRPTLSAQVVGLRHLGAGVAFAIDMPELQSIRSTLKAAFVPWLNSQDMQKWQPHITIQNKASRAAADALCAELGVTFHPHSIKVTGLDLWHYLGGPWQHEAFFRFSDSIE